MASFVHTVKDQAGPLRKDMVDKSNWQEIFRTIKRKVLNGHEGIVNLFNLTNPGYQVSLDTGKALDLMEQFVMVTTIVIGYKLQQFIDPIDVKHLAKSFLLYRDQQDFNNTLSKKKMSARTDDSSTTKMKGMIRMLRADPNTSMINMPNTDDDGLFNPYDVDMDKTQELLISGSQRDPILDFCILAEFVGDMHNVYTDKLDTMTQEDLVGEGKSEALHQRLQISQNNCITCIL